MTKTATIRNERTRKATGNVRIAGLTHADCRLLARAIEEGAWVAGDKGGPVSDAIVRFADLLRIPSMHPDLFGPVEFTVGASDPDAVYHERDNRPDLFSDRAA